MSGAADMARWAITSGSLIQGHYCHCCLDILRRVVHITKWTGFNWLLIISDVPCGISGIVLYTQEPLD